MNLKLTLPIAALGVLALGACGRDVNGTAALDVAATVPTEGGAAAAPAVSPESADPDRDDRAFATSFGLKHLTDLQNIQGWTTDATSALGDGDLAGAATVTHRISDTFSELTDDAASYDGPLAHDTTDLFDLCHQAFADSATALDNVDLDALESIADDGSPLSRCSEGFIKISDRFDF